MFSSRKRSWHARAMTCEQCGQELTAHRGCQQVSLRCPKCSKVYTLKKYAPQMDDDFEEEMGFVPMDRI